MRVFLATAGVLALAASAVAQDTGLSNVYSTTVNGDFVVAGAGTRSSSNGQSDPFSVSIAGVPGGATIVKAYASWNYLTNAPGTHGAITIDGNAVAGSVVGTGADLCWGQAQGESYLADVTSLVSGNGSYSIGGAIDEGGVGLGEGFSLLVIYDDGVSPAREVNVFAGYDSDQDGDPAEATFSWTTPYDGSSTHFFVNALDGQTADDMFLINGTDGSPLSGGSPFDAWQGLLGPGFAGTNYYDHAEGDVGGYLSLGDTSLTLASNTGSDCVGHSFGAISIVPEPASMALLALGALALRRRR